MASCKTETQTYRKCLKDSHTSGWGKGRCNKLAQTLEQCRQKWRSDNNVELEFDGTRILPNHKCKPLNSKVQHCLKWKKGDQSQCQDDIQKLNRCMKKEEGSVAAPTAGDKVWSDYKKGKKE